MAKGGFGKAGAGPGALKMGGAGKKPMPPKMPKGPPMGAGGPPPMGGGGGVPPMGPPGAGAFKKGGVVGKSKGGKRGC